MNSLVQTTSFLCYLRISSLLVRVPQTLQVADLGLAMYKSGHQIACILQRLSFGPPSAYVLDIQLPVCCNLFCNLIQLIIRKLALSANNTVIAGAQALSTSAVTYRQAGHHELGFLSIPRCKVGKRTNFKVSYARE